MTRHSQEAIRIPRRLCASSARSRRLGSRVVVALALALLTACAPRGLSSGCETSVDSCQAPWRVAPVHRLMKVSQSVTDSVITVRLWDKHRVTALYAFNNPCDDVITATVLQTRDTLDVRFVTVRRGELPGRPLPLEQLVTCEASIDNLGYEVTFDNVKSGSHTVRAFLSASGESHQRGQRTVYVP